MKRLLSALTMALLIVAWAVPAGAASELRILVNGKPLALGPGDPGPFIEDGRTMVPMRRIFEELGATVQWDGDTKTVTAARAGKTMALVIGNPMATLNSQPVTMSVPGQIRDGRTFVPLRFVAEALGAVVGWDAAIRTVTVFDLQYVKDADAEAVALLRTALANGRPAEVNLTSRTELVVGDPVAPRGSLAVDVKGQLRGADQLIRVDQTVTYGGASAPSTSELAVRAGKYYTKGPAESAFRPQSGPPDWSDLGVLTGYDPTRPFHNPFMASIRTLRRATPTEIGATLRMDLGDEWLRPVVEAAAVAWAQDPSKVVFDRREAEIQIRSADGVAQQVEIRVQGTIELPQSDGTPEPVPGRLKIRVTWQDPDGPIQWPQLP